MMNQKQRHIISFSSSFSKLPIDIPVSMESNDSFDILMCLEALGWPPRLSLKITRQPQLASV